MVHQIIWQVPVPILITWTWVFVVVAVALVAVWLHWGMMCVVCGDHTGSYIALQ